MKFHCKPKNTGKAFHLLQLYSFFCPHMCIIKSSIHRINSSTLQKDIAALKDVNNITEKKTFLGLPVLKQWRTFSCFCLGLFPLKKNRWIRIPGEKKRRRGKQKVAGFSDWAFFVVSFMNPDRWWCGEESRSYADRSWYTLPGENKINQHSPSIRTRPQMKGSLPTNILQGLLYDSFRDCIHVGKKHDPFESICFSKKRYLKKIHRTLNFITNPCVFFCGQLGPALMVRSNGQSSKQPCEFNTRGFCWLESLLFFFAFFWSVSQETPLEKVHFLKKFVATQGFPCSSLKVKGLDDVLKAQDLFFWIYRWCSNMRQI